MAAPYSGYTSSSVRLIEAGLSEEGWDGVPHIVAHASFLPPGFTTGEHGRGVLQRSLMDRMENGFDGVILFVGGAVRAEFSAMRRVTQT